MKVNLSDIVIKERQRLDLGDCTGLADSLRETGQIQAIGLNERHELIWGRRRLEAARLLGWTEIEAVVRTGLTSEMEQEIEYEEDARRKDRSWQELCLAVAKLKRIKEDRTGEDWSVRRMADFTGHGKSTVSYMLQVAAALAAVPRDEEMWSSENYLAAIKLLVSRTHKEVNAELERRRALFMQAQTAAKYSDEPPTTSEAEASPAPVQQLDTTPPACEVWVHGKQMAFGDVTPDDLIEGRARCVIAYNPDESVVDNVMHILAPEGFAILFFDDITGEDLVKAAFCNNHVPFVAQPHRLVWNKVTQLENAWPFSANYALGVVISKRVPHCSSCRSAVIAANQDTPGQLPAALVEAVLSACCPDNMPVYCIGGVPPVHVAATGRTPIWYEPDPEVFAQYDKDLVTHYEENLPGVVIKRRSVK